MRAELAAGARELLDADVHQLAASGALRPGVVAGLPRRRTVRERTLEITFGEYTPTLRGRWHRATDAWSRKTVDQRRRPHPARSRGRRLSWRLAAARWTKRHVASHELPEPRDREVDVAVVLGGVHESLFQESLADHRYPLRSCGQALTRRHPTCRARCRVRPSRACSGAPGRSRVGCGPRRCSSQGPAGQLASPPRGPAW
jgi:hypothetical protein